MSLPPMTRRGFLGALTAASATIAAATTGLLGPGKELEALAFTPEELAKPGPADDTALLSIARQVLRNVNDKLRADGYAVRKQRTNHWKPRVVVAYDFDEDYLKHKKAQLMIDDATGALVAAIKRSGIRRFADQVLVSGVEEAHNLRESRTGVALRAMKYYDVSKGMMIVTFSVAGA